jgi:glutamine amidotransferase
MQLLFESSEEDGGTTCLGVIPGAVKRFTPQNSAIKVPHMGWNPVHWEYDDPIWRGIPNDTPFYFVHGYYCAPTSLKNSLATCHHGDRFCAGVRHDSLIAVQFHPEKSGSVGLCLLENFLRS